jgi:transcriptional regulator with XRE-family HTH domain
VTLAAQLGAILTAARGGRSRRALAAELGVAGNTLRELELGTANPTLKRVEQVAGDLGIDITLTAKPANRRSPK